MQLYIDGEKQDLSEYESDNLAGLLEEVKSNFEGRMIHSLKVDGESMNPESLDFNPPLDEVESIDIESIEIKRLLEEAVDKLQRHAPEVRKGFQQAQAEFLLGDNDKGYEKLLSSLEDLEWCALFLLKMKKNSQVDLDTEKIKALEEGLKRVKKIIEFVQKQEFQDATFLIDTVKNFTDFAEEIEDLSEKYYEKVKDLKAKENFNK